MFPKNPVSSALVYAAIPDRAEILTLRNYATPDTIFLDIGANVGVYSLFLADCVKEVFAFEPHPETAKCCKMNFALNGISEKNVLEMAISDNDEPKYFSNKSAASPINHIVNKNDSAIVVLSTTLDQFIQSQALVKGTPFILKVDVEGFEFEVFNGAKCFLKDHNIKAIIFENFSEKINDIIQLLQTYGFVINPIGDNNLLAVKAS
ncbi:MAG: FkbM family methyltransferase [Candidatus Berkiella sp.]